MSDSVMTPKAYDILRRDIDRLEKEEVPELRERIAKARDEGDLSENAEYHGARERLALLLAKINEMKGQLSRAQIIDIGSGPAPDFIDHYRRFKVLRLNDNKTIEYTLVGELDEDFAAGKIPSNSPLGQGFMRKKPGDEVSIRVPAGIKKFRVLEINIDSE
ncbi:MAG: transcription elongation factor GreA [Thermoguttaceae bacterium]|nr:transcription elongation factor GreA [Thermoguttaceae bacterium]MBQ3453411.1 transcription elongation factor GreA [Thermoguttaceae bacterium]